MCTRSCKGKAASGLASPADPWLSEDVKDKGDGKDLRGKNVRSQRGSARAWAQFVSKLHNMLTDSSFARPVSLVAFCTPAKPVRVFLHGAL